MTTTTTLRSTTLRLTGSLPGPESPLPAFAPMRPLAAVEVTGADDAMAARLAHGRLGSPLPYARHSDYARADDAVTLPALVLDNGVLTATVLPTLGGRLWSLRDVAQDRDLVLTPSRLRCANFGLTDAWFAGGIEWNLGSTGHWTLSSRPLHAARVDTPSGAGLRLWEWERTRDLVLQVDLVLDGDRLLAHTRVLNPDPEPKPLYYWTNVAVPETPGTRVLSRASTAWRTDYAGRLARVAVPHPDGETDISYPSRSEHAADYFFVTDPPGRFVAAIEPDGHGLAQTATDGLRGRKLFLWGHGAGGARWQDWLVGPGARYAEIQAGWCTTQLEHDILDGATEVAWTEAFGAVHIDPTTAAGPFPTAAAAAAAAVHDAVPPAALATRHARWRDGVADAAPTEILHVASGWGRAELVLRGGAAVLPGAALPFPHVDDDSRTLVAALDGDLAGVRAGAERTPVPPVSDRWLAVLRDPRWDDVPWARYARAVNAQLRDEPVRAEAEYAAAVDLAARAQEPPVVGALRGLALLAAVRADVGTARRWYARALAAAPLERTLLTEAVAHELAAADPGAALALLDGAPPTIASHGRHRLLRAHALFAMARRDEAAALLEDLEVPDLAEGGRELDELWALVHPGRELPAHLDFRMQAG